MSKSFGNFILTFIIVFLATSHASFANENKTPTISVSGTGIVNVEPDMAIVSFGVLKEGKTARAALDLNNSAMTGIIASLKESGIENKDIQTSQFNIQPKYVYPKNLNNGETNEPRIVAYTVSNNVSIRVRDIKATGAILDQVVTLGVNSGGSISFTNSNIEMILEEARAKAVKQAITKATTLANAAGVRLGAIQNITEGTNAPRPQNFARGRSMALEASAADVPIASGEASYKVDVQMDWQINQ